MTSYVDHIVAFLHRDRSGRTSSGRRDLVILGFAVALGVLVPFALQSTYLVSVASQSLVYLVVTLGFYFVFGLSGQFSFAQGAFFAIGAVASVWGPGFGNFWFGVVFAVVLTTLAALVFRLLLIRVQHHFLAIATFALNSIALLIIQNWGAFSGGFGGRSGIRPAKIGDLVISTTTGKYYLFLGFAILAIVVALLLEHSPIRRQTIFTRELHGVAELNGVREWRQEVLMFSIAAAYAGLGGALYARHISYVNGFSFTSSISLTIFLMLLIGGIRSVWGAPLGALIVTFLPEVMRPLAAQRDLWYAAFAVLVVFFLPGGLVSVVPRARRALRRRKRPKLPRKGPKFHRMESIDA